MNNYLPLMSGLNVQALSRSFESTATSYKFMFFQAILHICSERGFTKFDGKVSCKELAVEMAAFAWYPHTFHNLSFGRLDELGKILDLLPFTVEGSSLANSAFRKKLRAALLDNYQHIGLGSLLRHVPFRLLTPFFESELRGVPDQRKISLIRALADKAFTSEAPPLYRLTAQDTAVEIHPKWLAYLQESLGLVNGWLSHNWVAFLQSRNPNVPAVPCKTQPLISRMSLNTQFKRWRRIIEATEMRCIYSGERLNPNHFEVDHFLPWSFICHDQPWNLVPVLPAANASKGNRLPDIEFVERFIKVQSIGLSLSKHQLSVREWALQSEPYLADLRISEDDLLSHDKLSGVLKPTMLSMIALAKQSGFTPDWKYRNKLANSAL
jgi:HNH endonuclease